MPNDIEVTFDGLYDNGGETFDRYTALFWLREDDTYTYWHLGMSEDPVPPTRVRTTWRGRRIRRD